MNQKKEAFKDHGKIFFHKKRTNLVGQRIFFRRSWFLIGFVFLCFSILILRLFFLQVYQHDRFTTLAEANRLKLLPLPPVRGLIFDRNGVLLANNVPSFNLMVTPQELEISVSELYPALQKYLTLTDIDIERFERLLEISAPQRPILLRTRLTEEEIAKLSVNLYHLSGVEIQPILTRVYPHGDSAVHALGYVGRIDDKDIASFKEAGLNDQYTGISHTGKRGAEASFENILRGQMGYEEVETNVRGKILHKLSTSPALPGKNIYLSLDIRLQKFVERALGDFKGAAVAIDPRNGDILAFASQPRFDPNLFVNGINSQDYKELSESPDKPFLNRVLQGRYPPGSTIKPMVGLAGLELGFVNKTQKLNCAPYYRLPNSTHKFRDWNRYGHGYLNLAQSIKESCDIYFYDLAYKMGINNLTNYMQKFGFGNGTGIDLVGEFLGVLPTPEFKKKYVKQSWFPGDTVTAGIGQSYWLVTPMQLAHSTGLIAKRGHGFSPKILYATQEPGQEIQKTAPKPAPVIELKDDSNWDYIINSMVAVIHEPKGTAYKLRTGLNYKIAGKSGTAQIKTVQQDQVDDQSRVIEKYRDHALFTAFAPASNPEIVVAVIVENGVSGSAVAGGIAKVIINAWMTNFKEMHDPVLPKILRRSE